MFDPWVGKIPWRREGLPTPVFWPGEFHRPYSPWDGKESDTTEQLALSLRHVSGAHQLALVVKNLPASAGDIRDVRWIPGLGRFPGGGNGNSLQYSCLENPMDRGAWRATVHRVANSQVQLNQLSTHACKNVSDTGNIMWRSPRFKEGMEYLVTLNIFNAVQS